MNTYFNLKKLENMKAAIVPALFAERQFDTLLKRLGNKKLSQVEKNYMSNSIKRKVRAINLVKHLGLSGLYGIKKEKAILHSIIASYQRAGIEMLGYGPESARPLAPAQVVEEVIENSHALGARIVDLLPVYMLKNLDKLNLFEIYSFAVEKCAVNFTGYLLNILYIHIPQKRIKELLTALEKKKDRIPFARDAAYEGAYAIIPADKLSRKWNIITLNKADNYGHYFKQYAGQQHTRGG